MAGRTQFTLDAIGRNLCNTFDEATQNPDGIDVVVIGSGMYGGYLASDLYYRSLIRLAEHEKQQRPLRILVLEAGPLVALEHVQNLPDVGLNIPPIENIGPGSNPPVREHVWGQGWRSYTEYSGQAYCVGGKGIYWGGWSPRQNYTFDLPQWPADMVNYLTKAPFPNPQLYCEVCPIVRGAYEYLEWQTGVQPSDDFIFDSNKDVQQGLYKVLFEFLAAHSQNEAEEKKQAGKEKIVQSPDTTVSAARYPKLKDAHTLPILVKVAPIAVSTRADASGMFANNKFSSLPGLISALRRDHTSGWGEVRTALVPNCHVSRLKCGMDSEGAQTKTIQFIEVVADGTKKTLQIPPHCQVVIAASAIESTRLALESFSLVDAGLLPKGNELMGNNLHTHHRFDLIFRFPKQYLNDYLTGLNLPLLSELLQVTAIHIDGKRKAGEMGYQYQLFAASNTLSGDFQQNQSPDDLLYKLTPNLDLARFIKDHQNSSHITIILRASGEMATNRTTNRNVPGANWVDLASDADADGPNNNKRAWVHWADHSGDAIWETMFNEAVSISKLFGDKVEYWIDDQRKWSSAHPTLPNIAKQQGLGTTYHDSGTLWMGQHPVTSQHKGENAEVSVLDSGAHFHHVTNAYCCDQAAFPTCAVANPVPTGLAVARKAAADIFGRHSNLYKHYVEVAQTEKHFKPLLIDGERFQKEWKSYGPVAFTVEPGVKPLPGAEPGAAPPLVIRASGHGGTESGFLWYHVRQFENVKLNVEWKTFRVPAGADLPIGGIFLNAQPDKGGDWYGKMSLIKINQGAKNPYVSKGNGARYGDSLYKTGSVFGIAPATRWMAKVEAPRIEKEFDNDGYWNEFKISIADGKVEVMLNHKIVCETTLSAPHNKSGFIGLEVHSGEFVFRNIRVDEAATR